MDPMVFLLVAALVLLGLAAHQWGADSRIPNVDSRYPSTTGIR